MRAAAVVVLVLAASCSTDRCKDGTVFLSYTLSGGAEAADTIDVTLAISGGAARTMSVAHNAGNTTGSIEVDFAGGYPSGQSLAFTLTARAGPATLASTSATLTASGSCATLELALDGGSSDLAFADVATEASTDFAQPRDLTSSADLTPTDLSSRADLASPADLSSPADLTGSPDLTPPPLCQTVVVSTLAGNGSSGFVDGTGGATGTTEFYNPLGVAVDSAGNAYVADMSNNRVRKIAPGGSTTTLAGNGLVGFSDGTGGATGTTKFQSPVGVAVDNAGYVYVADRDNNRIRKVAPDGSTTTLAGNGTYGGFDGTGGPTGTTTFRNPYGVAVDGAGNVYVAGYADNRIRKVAPDGSTTTLAGNGTAGFVDGTGGIGGTTEFNFPTGVAIDGAGNVYVADGSNNRIRKVAPSGSTTTLAGNGTAGFSDGTGGPTGTAEFYSPLGVAVDGAGNVYVADERNNRIRMVAPGGTTTSVAGDGTSAYAEGAGCTARFNLPRGVAVSGKQLFVGDTSNSRVRLIQLP
jgi:hypothetical protein